MTPEQNAWFRNGRRAWEAARGRAGSQPCRRSCRRGLRGPVLQVSFLWTPCGGSTQFTDFPHHCKLGKGSLAAVINLSWLSVSVDSARRIQLRIKKSSATKFTFAEHVQTFCPYFPKQYHITIVYTAFILC